MKIGDLVCYDDGLNDDAAPGLVLEVISWAASPRVASQYGIKVLWSSGERMLCCPSELKVLENESR